MRLKAALIGVASCALSACNSLLPAVYTPVIEPPAKVDVDTPLAHMVYKAWSDKKNHAKNTVVESTPAQTKENQLPESASMKSKRLGLSDMLKSLNAEMDDRVSGVFPLIDGVEAFAVRNALIKNAKNSLDLQYYSLHKGLSSRLLIRELVRAADRGVRIRVLIDDMDTLGRDKEMTILGAHPNIEVRIFNPIRRFRGTMLTRGIMFLSNLSSQHRRMHNKVWLADGVLGITGGRNIGDQYFNAQETDNFSDLDVLLSGAAVKQMQSSFEQFWNSSNSVPVEVFEKAPETENIQQIQKMIFSTNALTRKERVARHPYLTALNEAENNLLPDILSRLMWGQSDFYSDSPDKVDNVPPHLGVSVSEAEKHGSGSVVFDELMPKISAAKHEVIIANPYFVPGNEFVKSLADLIKKGVKVTVLTNSLESNDVPLINGPYSRYRVKLLQAGVNLFELRGFPNVGKSPQWRLPIFSWKGSRTALHSKAVVIDGETSFVGSMNLDPRSIVWNTEVGVITTQKEFASSLRTVLLNATSPLFSYELSLNAHGDIEWRTESDDSAGFTLPEIVEKVAHKPTDHTKFMPKKSNQTELIKRERGNFWRRIQKHIGAWLPETFL